MLKDTADRRLVLQSRILLVIAFFTVVIWGLLIYFKFPFYPISQVPRFFVLGFLGFLLIVTNEKYESIWNPYRVRYWGAFALYSLTLYETIVSQWPTLYVFSLFILYNVFSSLVTNRRAAAVATVFFLFVPVLSLFFSEKECPSLILYVGAVVALFSGVIASFARFDLLDKIRSDAKKTTQIFSSMQDGILLLSSGLKVEYFNKGAAEILGGHFNLREKKLVGLDLPFERVIAEGVSVKNLERKIMLQGAEHFLLINLFPYFDGNESSSLVIASISDISELKRSSKIIAEQNQVIVASSRISALGEMAASIAHEINNPLSIIAGKAYLLKEMIKQNRSTPDKIIEIAEKIENVVSRIGAIVKSMRLLSRNGENDGFEGASVSYILEQTLGICRERFSKSSIELIIEVPANILVRCRPVQVAQVMLNLLVNAYDAVEELPEKWVRVTAVSLPELGKCEILFTDSGHGIPLKIQEKLMQPFFTTKELGRGTGLGLSVSCKIADAHGGKLRLNTTSQNTQFILELPLMSAFTKNSDQAA